MISKNVEVKGKRKYEQQLRTEMFKGSKRVFICFMNTETGMTCQLESIARKKKTV